MQPIRSYMDLDLNPPRPIHIRILSPLSFGAGNSTNEQLRQQNYRGDLHRLFCELVRLLASGSKYYVGFTSTIHHGAHTRGSEQLI